MLRFFRTIRQRLLSENRFTRYLIYALGEIILVVIGILIALAINNWNSQVIAKKQLRSIYQQIHSDLIRDTSRINQILTNYESKSEMIQNIIDREITASFYDTITPLNFNNCKICRAQTTGYRDFQPITKGFDQLIGTGTINSINRDSLSDEIYEFYNYFIPNLEESRNSIDQITDENIKSFEQYSWFIDWIENRYNSDYLTFLFESKTYRKQLARYRLYYEGNYLSFLRFYGSNADNIIRSIEQEL